MSHTQVESSKKHPLAPLVENITESGAACLVTMVQGNLLALSLTHWLIASRTGLIAGLVATAAIMLARTSRRWVIATLLGVATALVDFFVHPGQFGRIATEAILTGAAAALLSYVVALSMRRAKREPAAGSSDA